MQKRFRAAAHVAATLMATTMLSACGTTGYVPSQNVVASTSKAAKFANSEVDFKTPVRVYSPKKDCDGFAKDSLSWYVCRGLQSDPGTLAARLGMVSASAGVAQAEASLSPNVSVVAHKGYTDNAGTTNIGRTAMAGLQATWTLFDGGAGALKAESERYKALKANAQADEQYQAFVFSVAKQAAAVMSAREQLALAKGDLKQREADLAAVKGLDMNKRPGDEQAASASVEQGRSRLFTAQRRLDDEEAIFFSLTGEHLGSTIVMASDLVVERTVDDAVISGSQHPSLRIANAEIGATMKAAHSIDAERFGKLGLSLSPGFVSDVATGVHKLAFNQGLVQLDLPIFDGDERGARLRQALAQYNIAEATRERIERTVNTSIRQGYNAMVEAVKQAGTKRDERAQWDAYLKIKTSDYQLGGSSLKDVLDARKERALAQAAEVDARWLKVTAQYFLKANQGALADMLGVVDYREVVVGTEKDPFASVTSGAAEPKKAAKPAPTFPALNDR